MCEARTQRGTLIAAVARIVKKGAVWLVPSQTDSSKKYTVSPDEQSPFCNCMDHETRGCDCKHIIAVRLVIQREQHGDGTETITQTTTVVEATKRATYPQDWPAYNAAQTNEKRHFQVLLRDLCQNVEEPASKATGRPPMPLRDALFAAIFKVYSGFSARRFMTDMKDSHANGFVNRCPSYNSIFKCLESDSLTSILTDMVVRSGLPLRSLESEFAVDASGFSSNKFVRWFEYKHGGGAVIKEEHQWVKCHLICGTQTHVVSAIEITEKTRNDSPMLPSLLQTTSKNFTVNELSADSQYGSVNNIEAIVAAGADPYVQFRQGITGAAGGVFGKAYHYFAIYRQDFLDSYHRRSNVESVFSMVKRKFGDSVRSKTDTAMKNEVLAKFVCHNICCLIACMYELNLTPNLLPE